MATSVLEDLRSNSEFTDRLQIGIRVSSASSNRLPMPSALTVAASRRSWAVISRTPAAYTEERSAVERSLTVIRDANALNFDC
jgi:hypothetical protein